MKYILLPILIALSSSCSSSKVYFDLSDDTTVFQSYPIGKIGLPGIWKQIGYYTGTRQHLLVKQDTLVSVVVATKDDYSWEYDWDHTEFGFVKRYYERESYYQMERRPYAQQIIYSDSLDAMIVWRLDDPEMNYAICFKRKNLTVYSIILYGDMSNEYRKQFFKRIKFY